MNKLTIVSAIIGLVFVLTIPSNATGNGHLTDAEIDQLKAYISFLDPTEYDTPEKLEKLYSRAMKFYAVAEYARKQGLDSDPAIQHRVNTILQSELIRTEVDSQIRLSDISNAEVETYFRNHSEEFEVPARCSGHLIQLSLEGQVNGTEELISEIQETGADLMSFMTIAASNSVHGSGEEGGYVNPFYEREYGGQVPLIPEQLIDTISVLRSTGEISEPVIIGEYVYLFRLDSRTESIPFQLPRIREKLRYQLYLQKRGDLLSDLMSKVAPKQTLELSPEQLDQLKNELSQSDNGKTEGANSTPVPDMPLMISKGRRP